MTRVIMHGCNGRMGQMITRIAAADPDVEIVAGVDINNIQMSTYPVFASITDCDVAADAIIDFANAAAVDTLLNYSVTRQIPVVLCTTGLSEEQLSKVEETSKKVAILKSANMSMGINLLMKVLAQVSPILTEAGFDVEILDRHHRNKLDAPSGTAIALAEAVNEGLDEPYEMVFDRSTRREVRPDKEIGFAAVRGGSIVGDHDVIFAGLDEVVTFSHNAYSREVFAKGAVEAAKFLGGKEPGWYTMADVIQL